VLVVENDADLRALLSTVLAEERYEVESVAGGAEARAALRRRRPDLVVLDIPLPGVDGRLFRDEQRQAWWEDIPVLVLTGGDRAAWEKRQVGAVLRKPFGLDALLEHVRQLAGEPSCSSPESRQ
jgi:DNA-binding response OmpR family regulator